MSNCLVIFCPEAKIVKTVSMDINNPAIWFVRPVANFTFNVVGDHIIKGFDGEARAGLKRYLRDNWVMGGMRESLFIKLPP